MNMANSSSLEDPHTRLDKLHYKEEKLDAEKEELNAEKKELLEHLRRSTTTEEKSKIFEVMKTSNERINSIAQERTTIAQERMKILDIMKIQLEKGAVASPNKKIRRSLPPPTSGYKWTFEILRAYGISFKKVYSIDELLFQAAPVISDRAKHFTNACSMISLESIFKFEFPSDHNAACLAKHLYINTSSCFGHMEASIDDMVYVLFNALGFNDEDLITVSRNKLRFTMSKKSVCAEADLTVFNLKTLIRLAVVEDKRWDETVNPIDSGEPQLIAEAVAAAMYNRHIPYEGNPRRAISEPPNGNDSTGQLTTMMNSSSMEDTTLFLVRIFGPNVFFYSHKFSDALLKSIADGIEPLDHTQIQKFTCIANDQQHRGLSLLIAEDRVKIIEILDGIQQTIFKK